MEIGFIQLTGIKILNYSPPQPPTLIFYNTFKLFIIRPKVTSFLSFFSTVSGLVGIILPGFWFNSVDCETTETCNRD